MKKDHVTIDRGLGHVVERQLRNWEIGLHQKRDKPAEEGRELAVEEFITISCEVGLPGQAVAAALEERMKWPVFDREILTMMSGDDASREKIYRHLDGRDLTWLEVFMMSMVDGRMSREDHFHRLTETVLALARKGRSIFLGRGADLILPRDQGLRVRLIADREYRMNQFAEERRIPPEEAERLAAEIDEERARFLRAHFGADAGEPSRFDLSINMKCLNANRAADLITATARMKGFLD